MLLYKYPISCIFNQPFSFILSDHVYKSATNDTAPKTESCEPQEYQGLQADLGGADALKNERFGPQILFKNQEVRPQNLTSVLSGWSERAVFELNRLLFLTNI